MMGTPFDPHSAKAAAITRLFTESLLICGAIFVLVTVLVFICIFKFRAAGRGVPQQVEGNRKLEIAWTLAPILVLAGLLSLTVHAMAASDPPADHAPDLTIVGHQWWWEVKYASGAITANEIHIPVGKPLVVRLESADVIHDFWVPELGRKLDAVPGHPGTLWLEADDPGTYAGACAEYCGIQHAWMRILVVAETPEAYRAWEEHQLAPAPSPVAADAVAGSALFQRMTCASCHAIGGTVASKDVAPDLTHLAERATLGAGVLTNSPENLARWLKDPQSIKEGCHMPNAQLSDTQVGDLVAYFETLR